MRYAIIDELNVLKKLFNCCQWKLGYTQVLPVYSREYPLYFYSGLNLKLG